MDDDRLLFFGETERRFERKTVVGIRSFGLTAFEALVSYTLMDGANGLATSNIASKTVDVGRKY